MLGTEWVLDCADTVENVLGPFGTRQGQQAPLTALKESLLSVSDFSEIKLRDVEELPSLVSAWLVCLFVIIMYSTTKRRMIYMFYFHRLGMAGESVGFGPAAGRGSWRFLGARLLRGF